MGVAAPRSYVALDNLDEAAAMSAVNGSATALCAVLEARPHLSWSVHAVEVSAFSPMAVLHFV